MVGQKLQMPFRGRKDKWEFLVLRTILVKEISFKHLKNRLIELKDLEFIILWDPVQSNAFFYDR